MRFNILAPDASAKASLSGYLMGIYLPDDDSG